MSVFIRRGGSVEPKFTVEVVDSTYYSSYTTVAVNLKSLSAGTYRYDEGTELVCTVSGWGSSSSTPNKKCYISVNGTTVLTGAGSYTYKLTDNVKITLSNGWDSISENSYGVITITTT